MTTWITRNKDKAISKLHDLFDTKIISDVKKIGRDYIIEYLSQKEYYVSSVEAQKEMPKYLQYLLQEFDEPMEQKEREAELNEQIEDLDETVANNIKDIDEEEGLTKHFTK